MAKHTPGPWKFWDRGSDTGNALITDASGECGIARPIARICGQAESPKEMQANARLMAASPEMLEALQLIQGFNWQLDDSEHGKEIKRRALEAIKKATGR